MTLPFQFRLTNNYFGSLSFPKAVLQLAWRPASQAETSASHTLAVAGEDTTLRLLSFDESYLRHATER